MAGFAALFPPYELVGVVDGELVGVVAGGLAGFAALYPPYGQDLVEGS